jgi:RNA-directed DNA polymerase
MSLRQSESNPSVPTRLDLYSLCHLEALLGHSRGELEDLAKHAVRYYRPFPLSRRKRPFSRDRTPPRKRWIDNPIDPLKAVQSRIEDRLLKRVILPEHLLGGVKGRSIPDNARRHLRARYLVTIDIRNFFPSISPEWVHAVWRVTLNCSPPIAYLMTGLTTCRGRLPQGAPTSTLLANLVLSSFDEEIRAVCEANGVAYSSWVDDLAFSGDSAPQIIGPVIAVLTKAGFRVSHQKIEVMGPRKRKILNKLVLGRFVTVQQQYVERLKAGVHNLRCGKIPASDIHSYIESLEGSISYLRLFDARKAARLRELLAAAKERRPYPAATSSSLASVSG